MIDQARRTNLLVSGVTSFTPSQRNGGSRIRTCEGMSQQIYSLSRLTASVSPPLKS